MKNIKNELKKFYDKEAQKYAKTREKYRKDGEHILNIIKKTDKKTLSILEFGCGSGRFLEYLQNSDLKTTKINYIGIDLSENLLNIAKKNFLKKKTKHIKAIFICDDISNYIKNIKQESFDFVIGIASFQHIPDIKERIFLMKNFYRILKYEGSLIMINRALSRRFLKKYKFEIIKSFFKSIFSLGISHIRDIMIPRISTTKSKQIHYRFYHIFTLKELKKLCQISGFVIENLLFLNKESQIINDRKLANNSFLVAKKNVFIMK